jgi:holliday junction DNA helicase RuvB
MSRGKTGREPASPIDRFEGLDGSAAADERQLDVALRPTAFDDFVGQERSIENLKVAIAAARSRREPLEHLLLSGPPGLGKTTLANLVAREMDANLRATSGPAIERVRDLAGVLTNLKIGDVLFVDEIHRLPAAVEECLYSAMEDFTFDIVIDQGPNARSIRIDLEKFTLVGATTREGLLSAPLRARFGLLERLDFYPVDHLSAIVERSARLLDVRLDDAAVSLVAKRSRGTPRIANRLLRRVRDLGQVKRAKRVDEALAIDALTRLGIDDHGLGEMDRRILAALVRAGGEPVGLKTIAITVGEEPDTLEEVYEPFLVQQGFVEKTPRGRKATDRAFDVLGVERGRERDLFA